MYIEIAIGSDDHNTNNVQQNKHKGKRTILKQVSGVKILVVRKLQVRGA